MKKLLLVVLAGLFIGACAQKTCPTYSFNDLNSEHVSDLEEQTV